MKILGYEISKSSKEGRNNNRFEDDVMNSRPGIDQVSVTNTGGVNIPYWPLQPRVLKDLALYSDVLNTCVISIRREVFRKGIIYSQEEVDHVISENEQETVLDSEKEIFKNFKDRANNNDQTLIEVLGELEDDLNIYDDAYLLFNQDYSYDSRNNLLSRTLKELVRVNPGFTRIISDRTGLKGFDDSGKKVYVCPAHRDQIQKTPYCSRCGVECLRAHYRYDLGGDGSQNSYLYYGEGEIVHASKYHPSVLYGFSPVLSVWQKVTTLMNQDKYIMEYYGKQRPPKGALFVNTRNQDSLTKAWDWLLSKARTNPHIIHPLGVETNSGSGNVANFIDFMSNLDEMQFTQARDEFRRTIGALFGVSPIFQNDVSTSGGLNNEGLQVTVTNRAVESSQQVHNNKFLIAIKKALGISSFTPLLAVNDEIDKSSRIQRQSMEIDNATKLLDVGVPVVFNDDGSFGVKEGFDGVLKKSDGFSSSDPMPSNPFGVAKKKPLEVSKKTTTLDSRYEDIINKNFQKINADELNDETIGLISSSIGFNILQDLKENNEQFFKTIYKDALETASNEVDVDIGFEQSDNNTLSKLLGDSELESSYQDLSEDITRDLNNNIRTTIDKHGFNMKKIREAVKDTSELAGSRAQVIARTESQKIANAARIKSFEKIDPEDKGLYDWVGPDDSRTTVVSKNIKRRVGSGVSRGELIRIIQEESSKVFPEWRVNPIAPVSHYQSRHTLRYLG